MFPTRILKERLHDPVRPPPRAVWPHLRLVDLCRRLIPSHCRPRAILAPGNRHHRGPAGGSRHRRLITATTSWTWPIRSGQVRPPPTRNGCRSIRPPSSATCARSDLRGPTICGLTCGPILMKDHLFALSVVKPLRDNMIESDTKDFIPEKRSSCVAEICRGVETGAVTAVSLVQMH